MGGDGAGISGPPLLLEAGCASSLPKLAAVKETKAADSAKTPWLVVRERT